MLDTDRRFRLLVTLIVVPSVIFLTAYSVIAFGGSRGDPAGGTNKVVVAPNVGGVALVPQPNLSVQPVATAPALGVGNLAKAQPAAQGTAMPGMAAMPGMSGAATAQPSQATSPHMPYDAALPALLPLVPGTTNVRTLALTTSDEVIQIADGVHFQAWTFGGTVPGPVVHVKQGDTVRFTLTNRGNMPHSIDFHAAQVPPDQDYVDVKPGASESFDWTADYPGVFMYHCGSPLVIAHMASGMYGAVVVDPATPLPAAREYVIVQSEFYTTGTPGAVQQVDVNKVENGSPDYVVFNGYANQYKDAPLTAKTGELVRFYIVNAGPNDFSAFHVIGTIFENTYADGNIANIQHGNQTVTIPPGGAYMVEFTIPNPGSYAFVTHSFSAVAKGAVGVLKVTP
jgi:nitrite reductase (NO-forming)